MRLKRIYPPPKPTHQNFSICWVLKKYQIHQTKKLLDVSGVQFFSVQRDAGLDELDDSRVEDLSGELTSWQETAAALNEMDLVISSCTSVVHLAAAMGKPVWVASTPCA